EPGKGRYAIYFRLNERAVANFLLFYQRITQVIFQVRFICPGRGKWLILDVGLQTGKITLIPIL
ncbi:hypothetical protein, partial [Duncaniella muris]|uniref:hypothetical protein n=1 Tax=Duncaniella muris TaxID=2094150 RepID=UPI00271450CE